MSSSTETLSKEEGAKSSVEGRSPDSNDTVAGTESVATDPGTAPQQVNITGRAVFAVETTGAGVVVRTAFLTEDNRLLDMPAVFPDMVYALNVVEDLKRQIVQHFSQAAQVGAQVIANQMQLQAQQQNQQQQKDPQHQSQETSGSADAMAGSDGGANKA